MVIPVGVNQIEFYKAAKKKGVVISSRYKGVYVDRSNGDIVWGVIIKYKGKFYNADFPFTERGELDAYNKYLRIKKELGMRENKSKTKLPV